MVANWIFAVTPYLSDEIQGGRRWNDQLRLKLIEGFETFEKKKTSGKVNFCTQIGSEFRSD